MIKRKTTKELLSDSLIDLMLNKSFNSISVQKVVDNCGLSRRTFYNYFNDKYELIEWIYQNDASKFLKLIGNGYSWYIATIKKLNTIKTHQEFYSKVYREEYFVESFYKISKNIYNDIIKKYKNIDTNLELLIDFYCYGCETITARWVNGGMKETPEEIVNSFIDCLPKKLEELLNLSEKIASYSCIV